MCQSAIMVGGKLMTDDGIISGPIPEETVEERPGFAKELESLINRYSMENGSDTPDFILAEYILNCLTTFNVAVKARERWYGRPKSAILVKAVPPEGVEG